MEHQVSARQEGDLKFVWCGHCGEERPLPLIGWTTPLGSFLAEHAPCRR